MLRSIGDGLDGEEEPQPIPDALVAPYYAYVSPRAPADDEEGGGNVDAGAPDERQHMRITDLMQLEDRESKPLQQLRAYLQREEERAARPWWRLRSASYLLLVLVGLCYLGGRSLLLRYAVVLLI